MRILTIILFSMILSSCNYLGYPIKIIAIEDYSEDNDCIYITNQKPFLSFTNLKFIAPCGVYNVGDTLKLSK